MRILDITSGSVVAENATTAETLWTRFRGLMLKRTLAPGAALVIRPCGSIHMMFMRFRIDAVFFDEGLVVTRVARRLPKWRGMAFGGRGAAGVIELPVGQAEDVEPGHQLSFLD